jgi:uncharacterized protein (UPF0335 family)
MTIGHNGVDASRLLAFVERVEKLEEEIRALNDDKKELYSEARGTGYDPKILKRVVAIRRMDRDKRQEEEAILDLYLGALGMAD